LEWAMKWQEVDGGSVPCSGICYGILDKAL
jgi:hypothetical protein